MSRRRTFTVGTAVAVALSLAAVMENRAHGQSTMTGSRTGSSSSSGSSSGSSASSVGGGFTGGGAAAGGGFTGGGSTANAGFTGSAGTGTTGTGGRGTGGASGTSTQVPVSANPFLSTYVNPYSAGMVSTSGTATATKAFGQPIYGLFSTATSSGTTTGTGTGNLTGGAGGVVASTSISGGVGFGYNTYGQGRTYQYAAVPGDTVPMVIHANPQLQTSVSDVLLRSTSFRALEPLKVTVNESTVTLEGTVGSAKEKRIVEGMVRMTPGVRAVFNRLQISENLPAPKTGAPPIGQ